MSRSREERRSPRLVTLERCAKDLSFTRPRLYRLIEENHWGPAQGVFHFGPEKANIRIDEERFIHWRHLPTGFEDAEVERHFLQTILVLALPLKNAIEDLIAGFVPDYEELSKRLEHAVADNVDPKNDGAKPIIAA